ncbi:MAG: dienelactone hydrolase family protein [Burkholderiales bacterium]
MKETWAEVAVDGGSMAAFLARPGEPGPGLVMLQEIFGVNPAMQDKARTFAAAGYTVVVPDLFWRMTPRISLGYDDADRKTAFGYMQKFDFASGIRDIGATARWLEASGMAKGKVGVIGFCLGGKLAVAATAAYPFGAVASLYGVQLEADPGRLEAIQVPLQVHVGDQDAHVPKEAVESIKGILHGKPNARVFVYPGAQHGFFNAARPAAFSPASAKHALQRLTEMFDGALR